MEASAEAPLIKHTNMPSSTSIASVASPRQALPSIASFFCCPVCWGHTHWDNTVALSGCGHRFCVVCLKHALTMQISDGLVDLVCCSHVATSGAPRRCRRPIAAEDVRRVLTAETWKTFQRFRFYRNNPNARACPHCGHGQVVENGWEQPLCVCTQCSKTFCFLHDDAHPGDECATYTNAMEATEAPTRALLERTTRPCPRCYHAIEKSGTVPWEQVVLVGVLLMDGRWMQSHHVLRLSNALLLGVQRDCFVQ
ncbi:TPA: hypothetical protein N0F65_003026 [Lagenidium giganteum]|uniref:RBR-type E3 ubiquitin transferase n=1 Tax=Lagenidium giganteum TaxID=4803 RepID=A0AAV2YU49_9STRA|nr:TPA: hypothetical protein N0F65_003026 [Lagenidium giganteum]